MEKSYVDLKHYLPQFSLAERNRRWAAVWEEMGLNGFDCLLLLGNDRLFGYGNGNVRYLTQINGQNMGVVAIFPLEGSPVVFGSPPHMHDKPFPVYKAFNDWITDTRSFSGLKEVTDALKEMGYEQANIGLVGFRGAFKSNTISYQEYGYLLKALPKANFADATPLLEKVRMIKSAEEVEMLKISGKISRLKIDAMIRMSVPGVKECELFAEMVKTEISHGGEAYIFNLLASGSATDPNTIQHLLHGRGPNLSPTTRPLEKGDIVMTEFHTGYGGYLTACEKTVSLGKPPAQLQRVHDVAVECFAAGVEKFRPGATIGDVVRAFRGPAQKAGLDYVELGFHGHGLSSPEFPTMVYAAKKPKSGSSAGPFTEEVGVYGLTSIEIKENMVFATNIDIYDPAWRNDVGIMGPGDTILVTGKGPVRLCDTPLEFTIV